MNAEEKQKLIEWAQKGSTTSRADIAILTMLCHLHQEMQWMRQAMDQANEPGPDDEPSPFQSLNG